MSKTKTHLPIKFNFCQINLTSYNGADKNSSSNITRAIFNLLQKNKVDGSVKFFDRNETNDSEPRFIGVLSSVYLHKEKIIRGKMAMLRSKNPVLVDDKYNIEKIKELENKKFAEISHFSIDCTKDNPVLLFEKNTTSPRLSDLEYFFRHFGKENRLAKFCKIKPYIESISDSLIDNITSIEFIDLKVNKNKKKVLQDVAPSYYSSANFINNSIPFKNLRITTTYEKDRHQKKAINLAKNFFNKILNNSHEADEYELLQISYEVNNSGLFNKFDLLKDKKEITIDTEASIHGTPKSKILFTDMIKEMIKFRSWEQ
jgi:hypothetical protein